MVAIEQLSARQLANVRAIIEAALPFGHEAVVAALMAAGAESSWLRYANDGTSKRTDVSLRAKQIAAESLQFEHDRVAPRLAADVPAGTWDTTADSVGLYQQRPMYGYGTVAELMDPARSTRIFLDSNVKQSVRGFLRAPKDLTLAQRVQWTQGSEFPTGDNYAPFEQVARTLLNRYLSEAGAEYDAGDASVTPNVPAPPAATDWWSEMAATFDEAKAELVDVMKGTKPVLVQDDGTGWYYLVRPGSFRLVKNGEVPGIVNSIDQQLVVDTAVGTGLWPKPVALNVIQIAALRLASADPTPDSIFNNKEFH